MVKILNGGAYFLIGFFCLMAMTLSAQNQRVADSLIKVLEQENLDDSTAFEVLRSIAANETNPDKIILYSGQLIEKSLEDSAFLWLYRGYTQKGRAYLLKGDFDIALDAYFKGSEAASKIDYQAGIGGSYISIATVYNVSGNARNASSYYNQGIDILRQTPDSVTLATALLNAGDLYLSNDQLDSALLYFSESSIIFDRLDHRIGKAYNLGNIGMVYAKQGNNELAEQHMMEATQVLEDLGDRYPITVYDTFMADIYADRGDFVRAVDYASRSYQIATEEGLKEQIKDGALKLSELYDMMSQPGQAYGYLKTYVVYRDSINSEAITQQIADLRTEFEVSQKQIEVDLFSQQARNRQITVIALAIILTLLAVILVVLYRNNQHKVRTNQELEKLNHTKDHFFSIISHDLRGPVSAFYGISKIIRMHIRKKQYQRLEEMTENIDDNVQQLSGLLDNLLNWAVQQEGDFPYKPQAVSLNEMLIEVTDVFTARALVKNISITKTLEGDVALWVDRNSTMALLRNLISNAVKFTHEGGEIAIRTRSSDNGAVVEIADNGVGIPKEKLADLFSLKDDKSTFGTGGEKGVGLGLRLVQEFVQLNQGSISVQSVPGEGTTFTVILPLHEEEELVTA